MTFLAVALLKISSTKSNTCNSISIQRGVSLNTATEFTRMALLEFELSTPALKNDENFLFGQSLNIPPTYDDMYHLFVLCEACGIAVP